MREPIHTDECMKSAQLIVKMDAICERASKAGSGHSALQHTESFGMVHLVH